MSFIVDTQHMARCLRDRYVQRMTSNLRRPYILPAKFKDMAMWLKVAETCKNLNAHPDTFIDAAFAECGSPNGPFVSALYGAASQRWYHSYQLAMQNDCMVTDPAVNCVHTLEWCMQIIAEHLADRLQRGENEFDAMHDILKFPLFQFPAYVRVLLVVSGLSGYCQSLLGRGAGIFSRTANGGCSLL